MAATSAENASFDKAKKLNFTPVTGYFGKKGFFQFSNQAKALKVQIGIEVASFFQITARDI